MVGIKRKLRVQTLLVGITISVVVMVCDWVGLLSPIEHLLYDARVRFFQFHVKPASDAFVHIDIDDPALQAIGRFPWPRSKLAIIINELRQAKPKIIALDMTFSQAQANGGWINAQGQEQIINHDRHLALAFKQAGNVLLPIRANISQTSTPTYEKMVDAFEDNLELSQAQVLASAYLQNTLPPPDVELQVAGGYFSARRQAMAHRAVQQVNQNKNITLAQLRALLLPKTPAFYTQTPLLTELEHQLDRARSLAALGHALLPLDANMPNAKYLAAAKTPAPPIYLFGQAALATAFVDYLPDDDGVVRSMPLWVKHQDQLVPQMGLALACLMLDVDIKDVKLEHNRVVLPRKTGGDIMIPVRNRDVPGIDHPVSYVFDIPWVGPKNQWLTMYDTPEQHQAHHLPITALWELHEIREDIQSNNKTLDDAILYLLSLLDEKQFKDYQSHRPALDDVLSRSAMVNKMFAQLDALGYLAIEKQDPATLTGQYKTIYRSLCDLRLLPKEQLLHQQRLDAQLQKIKKRVQGKAAIIGWTASGATADFVPTALHAKSPGPVVHGAIFNGILSGELWRRLSQVWVLVLTLTMGLCGTLIVATLGPFRAMLVTVLLGSLYIVVNGYMLFDRFNILVGAAGPMLSLFWVWAGCTLHRYIIEKRERAWVEGRFRSYVDPALVDYVLAHPDQTTLDGQLRNMTVVFTDLAGFTTLSEKLREKTVPILNEYMGRMVSIIRQRQGYVNKFLGDGILFFFGSPRENKDHAYDAVLTALAMQEEMVPFNRWLKDQQLPQLDMRVGISTGKMVVGDAGSADASDYTVLGDVVNLGARLESANKATGTWIMLNDQAALAVRDRLLLSPIGRLQVVGKSQGVMVFEPVCLLDQANAQQKQRVEMADQMVNCYIASQFQTCIEKARCLEDAWGPSKLGQMYITHCQQYLKHPPSEDFIGQIVLQEK